RNNFIYTDFRLDFSEIWKGQPGNNFILVKAGGSVGGKTASTPGHEYILNPGEKIVVFATPSSFGNHNVIGIHQGLYRVGKGEDSPLYQVTTFPFGPGAGSLLKLQGLKDEVYRALGKPGESRPPSPPEKPEEKRVEKAAPAADPVP